MELALGLETAVKNAQELQSSGREFALMKGVNKLDSGDSEAAKLCYRCGKTSPWREVSIQGCLCPNNPLQETTTCLCTYSGEQLVILGQLEVEVQYGAQKARLPLCVVHGKGSSLLGQD